MRKYLYFWINKYRRLDDFDATKGYLFEDVGLSLSSEYNVIHKYDENSKELEIKINANNDYIPAFFTPTLSDIKAFVGNNGAGKTTLLRLLSDVISNKDLHERELEYVLVYVDQEKNQDGTLQNEFYYYKNTFERNSSIEKISFPEIEAECFYLKTGNSRNYSDDHSANLTIFYSPSFSGNAHLNRRFWGNGKNYVDISTDALLLNDKEAFSNPNTYTRQYYNQDNQLFYHSILEQNRLIDFLLNAGDVFFRILPVPQAIKMAPSIQGIELAISDLAVKITNKYNVYEIINSELADENRKKWLEVYERQFNEKKCDYEDLALFFKDFKYDKDELVDDIKDSWLKYYHSIKSLNDQFRFAALMSYTRTFYTNSYVKEIDNSYDKKLDLDLRLVDLPNEKNTQVTWKTAEFWKKNEKISLIKAHVEKIISLYDKCSPGYEDNQNGFATHQNGYFQNSYIIFNLREHQENLEEIGREYNSIFKLTDFITFGFTRPLSSGEDLFLRFYSRLYASLKDVSIAKPIDSIHLFIDEGELYLHPEWQRKWLDVFIKLMQNIEKTMWNQYDTNNNPEHPGNSHIPIMDESAPLQIQLFLSTHSPFMLTDMLEHNVLKLKRNDFGKTICENGKMNFFAGNIYDILKDGFFLEGTLGKYTERKIKELISLIENGDKHSEKLIKQIGDPILKALILQKKGGGLNDSNKS